MAETEYGYPAGVEELLGSLIQCEGCFHSLSKLSESGSDEDLLTVLLDSCQIVNKALITFDSVEASKMPARSADLLTQTLINTTRRLLEDVLPFQIPILARTFKKSKASCDKRSMLQRMKIEAEATRERIEVYKGKSCELMAAFRETWGPVEKVDLRRPMYKRIGDSNSLVPMVGEELEAARKLIRGHGSLIQLNSFGVVGTTDEEKIATGEPSGTVVETESRKKPTADQLMKEKLATDLDTVKGWTAQQWADDIGKSKSTVIGTPTWKSLSLLRQQAKAEKVNDRRKRNRPFRPK